MRPNLSIIEMETLFSSRRGTLKREGVSLSHKDTKTTIDVYQQWLLLNVDLGYLSLNIHRASLGRIIADLTSNDVMTTLGCFSEAVDLIRNQSREGFKALLRKVSVHLYKIYQYDILKMAEGDVFAAKRLNQVFSYPLRLSLTDLDLTAQCLNDYCATEDRLDVIPSYGIISKMNSVIKRWFDGIDLKSLPFKHGGGGVAGFGRTTLENKYKNLETDPLISYVFKNEYLPYSDKKLDRTSQTIFVAKSYKTFRTISMEPPTLMYLQQGILGAIDKHVESRSYLRNRIGTHEQRRNQLLAQEGSLKRNYATIDLSAASDSVSWDLVRRVFIGTSLYPYLVATRSRMTDLPDGRRISLKKFAPMGSALCFPVETIIFASICEVVLREHAKAKRDASIAGDYSVYGDDIIIPTGSSESVVHYLKLLGFLPNQSKSFTDSNCWFRESCGGEYVDGFDITPLRVSRNYTSEFDDRGVTGLIDLANQCFERGFELLRSYFLQKLRSHKLAEKSKNGNFYIPMFSTKSVHSLYDTNYHTKNRVCKSLQKLQVLSSRIVSKTERGNEDIAYRHWLESTVLRLEVHEAFVSNVGHTDVKVRNRWNSL
nr:MAG: RNA-dependent RNA polymerase [Riboviria sp.]